MLILINSNNNLIQNIKVGFSDYQQKFGIQYKQLKRIQQEIIKRLYNYHKEFVEIDIVDNAQQQ